MITMNLNRNRLLPMAAASVFVAACGGGSSNQPEDTNPMPGQDAPKVTAVPAATYAAGSPAASAFIRINELRASAGLGLVRQDTQLDTASASHARWLELNGGGTTTTQTTGSAGFSGATSLDRMTATGYAAAFGAQLVQGIDVAPVDALMGAPYSRGLLLQYRIRDTGLDLARSSTGDAIVLTLGRTATSYQSAPQWLTTWPPAGATGVPLSLYRRGADPIPENAGAPAGYPISVGAFDDDQLEAASFTLTDDAGAAVSAKLLTSADDTTLQTLGLTAYVALVPRAPLRPSTVYTVRFEGTLDSQTGRAPNFGVRRATWSFTTTP
jgi:uncharacterized protein YkwD